MSEREQHETLPARAPNVEAEALQARILNGTTTRADAEWLVETNEVLAAERDSLQARLTACEQERDELGVAVDGWAGACGKAEARCSSAERVVQLARAFVATTSYYRQTKASRPEFEALAVALAALQEETPE